MTPKQMTESKQGAFSRTFLNGFAEALTSACGYKWLMADSSDEDEEAGEGEAVRYQLTVEGDLTGCFALEFSRQDAIVVASSMLQEEEGEFGEMEAAALEELIQVAGERFRPERGAKYKSLRFTVAEDAEARPSAFVFHGAASTEAGKRVSFSMLLDQALLDKIAPPSLEDEEEEGEKGETISVTASSRIMPDGVNLDLVMDVELNVTLRFGKRRLSLREVLELTTGSVVELDRQVDEPVELLLDGVVIAKGEAVVIDGNYGLRVTEVAQPVSTSMLRGSAAKMQAAQA